MNDLDDQDGPMDGTLCRVTKNGVKVGAMVVDPTEQQSVTTALRNAGFQCDCGTTDALLDLKQECTEDDHEVCDVSVALAYGLEIASDEHVTAPKLKELDERGYGTVDELVAGLVELREKLPPQSDAYKEVDATIGDFGGVTD